MPAPQIITQFKITLLDTEPVIWRRIQVPQTYTFENLHLAIQRAMGWENEHLYMFRIGERGSEIFISCQSDDDPFYNSNDENNLDDQETPVARFLNQPGQQAIYEYDMGDSWEHEVLLEGIFLKEKGVKYPRCIAGERACPPENCGGTPGFAGILQLLATPRHSSRHEELMEWLDDEYDPKKFDPQAVKFTARR